MVSHTLMKTAKPSQANPSQAKPSSLTNMDFFCCRKQTLLRVFLLLSVFDICLSTSVSYNLSLSVLDARHFFLFAALNFSATAPHFRRKKNSRHQQILQPRRIFQNIFAHILFTKCTCLLSPISCLLSHVSCLTSPLSRLLFHISCLMYPV